MNAAEVVVVVAVSSPAWCLLLGVLVRLASGKRVLP